jgi:uncharacterized protein YoxC
MFESFDPGAVAQWTIAAVSGFNTSIQAGKNVRELFTKTKSVKTTGETEVDGGENTVERVSVQGNGEVVPEEGNDMANADNAERLSGIETRIDTLDKAVKMLAESVEALGQAGLKNSDSIKALSNAVVSVSDGIDSLSGAVNNHTYQIGKLSKPDVQ